jgi:hypothetical protein
MLGVSNMDNAKLILVVREPSSLCSGVAADVLHIEEQLGPLSSVPIEVLRRRLADAPLTLPPYVPATVAPAAAPEK